MTERRVFVRNLIRVTLLHGALLGAVAGFGVLSGCFHKRPPVVVPVEFIVEAPATAIYPEKPAAEPPPPSPPEPVQPPVPEEPPKKEPSPPQPRDEVPQPVKRPQPTAQTVKVSTQRVVRPATPAPTRSRPLTEEEIRRLLAAGATFGDRTVTPDDDQICVRLIHQALYAAWQQPSRAVAGEASAVAELTLGLDGRVLSKRLLRPSGNAAMDESVSAALERVRAIHGLTPDFVRRNPVVMVTFRLE